MRLDVRNVLDWRLVWVYHVQVECKSEWAGTEHLRVHLRLRRQPDIGHVHRHALESCRSLP